jgi:hypothetical protein
MMLCVFSICNDYTLSVILITITHDYKKSSHNARKFEIFRSIKIIINQGLYNISLAIGQIMIANFTIIFSYYFTDLKFKKINYIKIKLFITNFFLMYIKKCVQKNSD